MSKIKRIEEARSFQEKKEELENQLSCINKKIELNQSDCSHVGVYMGHYADNNGCRCVLCNSKLNKEQMLSLTADDLVIYAHNYLINTPTYMEKFDLIQTVYLGLCRRNEFASDEEIVDMFQQMIETKPKEENAIENVIREGFELAKEFR